MATGRCPIGQRSHDETHLGGGEDYPQTKCFGFPSTPFASGVGPKVGDAVVNVDHLDRSRRQGTAFPTATPARGDRRVTLAPRSVPDMLALQRFAGNRAVGTLIGGWTPGGREPADRQSAPGGRSAATELTVARQTATGGPTGPDPCMTLLDRIIALLDEVAQRFNDALDDRHDLYRYHKGIRDAHPDYGSWDGHERRYIQDRDELRRKLSEWDGNDDCRGRELAPEKVRDLAEAREFAVKEFPNRPANVNRAPTEDPSTRERIARALEQAGVPAWAVAALVVLVIAAIADPEPFSKVALLIGATAAVLFFVIIGRGDAVPSGAVAADDRRHKGTPEGSGSVA